MQVNGTRTLLQDWTVLVVDDEPDSLLVATRLLKFCGANVLTADNGKLGLEVAQKMRPQFIISDLSMPIMSGWEMLFHLQENRTTASIPVIALTAHAMDGDRQRAIEVGFHNYLIKPLQPETFIRDLLALLVDIPEIANRLGEAASSL